MFVSLSLSHLGGPVGSHLVPFTTCVVGHRGSSGILERSAAKFGWCCIGVIVLAKGCHNWVTELVMSFIVVPDQNLSVSAGISAPVELGN